MSDILLLAAIVMLVLLFLKVPVYLAVLGGSMVYFALNPHVSAAVFAQQTIIGTEKISLLAIPFFVCAGIFMNYTGVTKRIMDFCEVLTGLHRSMSFSQQSWEVCQVLILRMPQWNPK